MVLTNILALRLSPDYKRPQIHHGQVQRAGELVEKHNVGQTIVAIIEWVVLNLASVTNRRRKHQTRANTASVDVFKVPHKVTAQYLSPCHCVIVGIGRLAVICTHAEHHVRLGGFGAPKEYASVILPVFPERGSMDPIKLSHRCTINMKRALQASRSSTREVARGVKRLSTVHPNDTRKYVPCETVPHKHNPLETHGRQLGN